MPPKRNLPSLGLERRVRARREDKWQPEPESDEDGDVASEEGVDDCDADGGHEASSSEASPASDAEPEDSDDDEEEYEEAPPVDLSSVSFGALARAQASLPPSNRRVKKRGDAEDVDEAPSSQNAASRAPRTWEEGRAKPPPPKRSSKHAPQEQTSKKPVSRRREILADPRPKFRDPRFDPLVGRLDEAKARKAYAFLEDYRDSEMAELRVQIKKAKDANARDRLKRELLSMESRKKARLRREEAERVLTEHRQQEKDLVAQGKKPFYLKKSEQKRQALTSRFESMSKAQVDKAIERKRKKMAGKDKKEMGALERMRPRR